jgi:hypothetical protein
MSSDFVEVARPPYLSMAEEMRLFLEQHDIIAVLDSTNMGALLPYLGTAIGVPVLVANADATRASELLEHREPSPSTGTPWYCGVCRVDVEPAFESCWSCGEARRDVEQPFPSGRESAAELAATPLNTDGREKAETLIQRAWRVSIISIVMLPMVGHLYSLALLFESTGYRTQLGPEFRQLFRRTFLIDMFAIVAFGTFFTLIFRLY